MDGLIHGGAYFPNFYGMGRTKDRCMAIYNGLHNALLITKL